MTLELCKLRANYFTGQSFVSPSFLCILIFLFYLSLFFGKLVSLLLCVVVFWSLSKSAHCVNFVCIFFFFLYSFFFVAVKSSRPSRAYWVTRVFVDVFAGSFYIIFCFFFSFFFSCCISFNNISVHFTLLLLQPVANISTHLLCLAYSLSWCVCGVCVCCGYIYNCCSHSSCEKINKPKPAQVSPTCRAGNGQENRLPAPTSTSTSTRTWTGRQARWCRLSSAR